MSFHADLPSPKTKLDGTVVADAPPDISPDQRCLAAIEAICGDDWCEDQCLSNLDRPDGELKQAIDKLSEIYMLAHSHVQGPCYKNHEAWRKRVAAYFPPEDIDRPPDELTKEPGA